MENLVIRKLEAEELTQTRIQELIQFLYNNLDQFGDDLKSIEKCFEYLTTPNQGGTVFIAEKDSQLAGVTTILNTRMSLFIPENFLVYIAVSSDFRGHGIGKKILDKAKSELNGAIALHVEPENPAKRLYEREGFTNKYLEMRYNP
ncbi:MAG: GNAT family N-acetyltransferase [Bacteriovoracaceae bacterium]|nr:GNAT family N-acetyltransferase [Bacteriovoracaceae bacterium]